MFADRTDAGRKLLKKLPKLDPDETVILALPRGGLPVADVIAEALETPLDIALVRKVGFPGQPELALAAVTNGDTPHLTINESLARAAGMNEADILALAQPELDEIRRRREVYLKGRPPVPMAGKTVVVVDDGIATGATLRASLRLVRAAGPDRVLVAVPVGPAETITELQDECEGVICLETPTPFRAVGLHYVHFDQVPEATVTAVLDRHAHRRPSAVS